MVGVQGKLSPLDIIGGNNEAVPVSLDELRAEMKKAERQVAPRKRSMTAALFLGCWVDSEGNTVIVKRDSASSQELTATVMQPGRENTHLRLWQTTDNGVWHCGNAILGMKACSSEQLSWVSRTGSISTWTWTAFTMEALEARGLISPTNTHEQEPSAAFKDLAFHSSLDNGAMQEWVPVCVTIA
mmetsp:Transcript_40753/g.103635  ORF Transcript_40753/g.103635 Transcript_40753/m.103635 type:complete len:185 (+) Transcript_40753:119-673(+)